MLDKIKEFIKENLGIIFGVTTIGLCVNIVLLFPVLGNQVSQLILNITLVFNLFLAFIYTFCNFRCRMCNKNTW